MNKILIVTVSLSSGGLERIVSNIANLYIQKDWKVRILTLLNPEENVFVKLDSNVEIVNFKKISSSKASSLEKYFTVFKWIKFIKKNTREFLPNCILAMTIKIGSMCVIARKKIKTRLVVREISDPKSKARNQLSNRICFHYCKKADGFIFQTEWEKSCFPKKIQAIGEVIPNPIILNTMANENKNKEIITMGRLLNFQKRHDILLSGFAIFSKKHPDYTLKIYGEGPDMQDDIALAKKLNIEDKCIFAGAQKNIHELIKNAACFVITSDFEGLSNALLESFLMGIPSISSDWPGANEVITHGINGLIFERNNTKQLADMLCEIIENKELATKMSKNAKKEFYKYDANVVFNKYCAMIEGNNEISNF